MSSASELQSRRPWARINVCPCGQVAYNSRSQANTAIAAKRAHDRELGRSSPKLIVAPCLVSGGTFHLRRQKRGR
jgi:hypothetical protein